MLVADRLTLLRQGYCVMTRSWFDEYSKIVILSPICLLSVSLIQEVSTISDFQVAVDIDSLEPEIQAIMAQEPTVLPAWDPMGALAQFGVDQSSTAPAKL